MKDYREIYEQAIRIAKPSMQGFAVVSVEVIACGYICEVMHKEESLSGFGVRVIRKASEQEMQEVYA